VISWLSNGYNTILGKMFEKGEEIPIGEWQKVALARAFLRQNKMLILDN
jgi:ATP-binding cassette subfamily B protein